MRTQILVLFAAMLAIGSAQGQSKLLVRPPADDRSRQQIRVLDAVYGQDERLCNAQRAVANACDGQGACTVEANDSLCGNPYANVRKDLFIAYQCGDGRRTLTVREGKQAHVYCAGGRNAERGQGTDSGPRPPRNWRQNQIAVHQAAYGVPGEICDATATVANQCDGQSNCTVRVDNNLCGDPARGERKSAEIAFWCNGRLEQTSGRENGVANLNCR